MANNKLKPLKRDSNSNAFILKQILRAGLLLALIFGPRPSVAPTVPNYASGAIFTTQDG